MAEMKRQRPGRLVWKRLSKSKTAMAGLVIITAIIFMAIFADVIAPYAYDKPDYDAIFEYPSAEHWMGTDDLGRDIFSRVIYGTRVSLVIALMSVTISITCGVALGVTAAYFGGAYETAVMRLLDGFMAIPSLLLAISISSALGSGQLQTAIAIAISNIPTFARVSRASVMTVKESEFVEAARSIGARSKRIMLKHILPNALAPIFVQATLNIVNAILTIAMLSFIGLGIEPPTPEWGSMLSQGRAYIRDFWPIVTFPGVMIMVTVISFNMLGDGLRDALDPRLKR